MSDIIQFEDRESLPRDTADVAEAEGATAQRPRPAVVQDTAPADPSAPDIDRHVETNQPRSTGRRLVWLVLASGAATFGYGATTIRTAPVSEWGLLASASPAYAVSIILAALGFAIAIRQAALKAAVVATILMIVTMRLPRSIATDDPMYAWTYKHIGLVDYIESTHAVARGVDIYNSWPGMFGVAAWFSELTRVPPVSIAHWFTICFHLLLAAFIYAAARAWGLAPASALTATFLVATLNWVEQDYFSPQALTMLFAAGIFVVVGLSRHRREAGCLLIVLFAAATVTHQLTPYWILVVIVVLALSRKIKPWWIVFPLAAILIGYFFYNIDQADNYTMFSFNVIGNARSSVPTVGSDGQQFTSLVVRSLSAGLWVTAFVVLVVRLFKRQPFWLLGVLAFSPMLMLAGAHYEGEAIYRVFLYSLIGCCMIIAPVLVSALRGGVIRCFSGFVALLLATALAAQGYTGSWFANLMPADQVYGYTVLEDLDAEMPAYIIGAAPVVPARPSWRYVSYVRFDPKFDDPMIYITNQAGTRYDTQADYDKVMDAVYARSDAAVYLVFTDQMRVYSTYFGILPAVALPNLEDWVRADPRWSTFYSVPGMTVYQYHIVQ